MQERHPLIVELQSMADRDDRARLADLRKGLVRGREASLYPIVGKYFSEKENRWEEQALLRVAALFSIFPESSRQTIAAALRRIVSMTDSKSAEDRFVALLDAHEEDVFGHLRHLVSLCRSHDQPFDWNDVLTSLRNWSHEDRWVQRRWAREFWGRSDSKKTEEISDED